MHPQALLRRAGSAVAALVAVLLLSSGPVHAAAPGADPEPPGRSQDDPAEGGRPSDRPPAHAGGEDPPPPHAHSPAPEDRPPAHARARRASPGRSDDPAPAPAPADETGTELETDVVDPDASRPVPDRTQADVSSPVVVAAPAGSSPAPAPAQQPAARVPPTFAAGSSGGAIAPPLPRGPIPGDDPRPTPDILAAPPPSAPLDLFAAEDAARRVVVPLFLLVAGLAYLLAQGRIDRGGLLLTAPEVAGTEHDDDVFEL